MSDTKQFKKRRTTSLRIRKADSSRCLPVNQAVEVPKLDTEPVRMERVQQIREYLRSRPFDVDEEFRKAIGMLIEARFGK